jgi:hypothetical protein
MKHSFKKILIPAFFALIITGCHKPVSNMIHNIDAENLQGAIDLRLSDLANSFKLIPLETTKESLLDNRTEFYFNEDYILAYSENGVFKFTPSGKFVKKLVGLGRGPNEIVNFSSCIFVVDENNDLLYISNRMNKGTYLRYDLKSEHFIEPVKRALNAFGSFDIVNDSIIIVSNLLDDSKYAVYFQNLKGEFISGITNTKKLISDQTELPQRGILLKEGLSYYYYFQYDDTLFQIKGNKLIPYLALNFKTPRENPPKETLKNGDRFIYFQPGTPGILIIHVEIVEDAKSFYSVPSGGGKGYYLLFNNYSGKASRINSYTDNFIGETKNALALSQVDLLNPFFLELSPNKRIITPYYPNQIKKAIEKGLNYVDFPVEINDQLLKINEIFQETDNPILLIGIIKDKI